MFMNRYAQVPADNADLADLAQNESALHLLNL